MQTRSTDYWAVQCTPELYVVAKDPIRDGIVTVNNLGIDSLFSAYHEAEVILEEIVKMKAKKDAFKSWEPTIVQVNCTLCAANTINCCDYEITYKHRYQSKQRTMIIPHCCNPSVALLTFKQIMATRKYSLGSVVNIRAL